MLRTAFRFRRLIEMAVILLVLGTVAVIVLPGFSRDSAPVHEVTWKTDSALLSQHYRTIAPITACRWRAARESEGGRTPVWHSMHGFALAPRAQIAVSA